jgi:hypothetical protein
MKNFFCKKNTLVGCFLLAFFVSLPTVLAQGEGDFSVPAFEKQNPDFGSAGNGASTLIEFAVPVKGAAFCFGWLAGNYFAWNGRFLRFIGCNFQHEPL